MRGRPRLSLTMPSSTSVEAEIRKTQESKGRCFPVFRVPRAWFDLCSIVTPRRNRTAVSALKGPCPHL